MTMWPFIESAAGKIRAMGGDFNANLNALQAFWMAQDAAIWNSHNHAGNVVMSLPPIVKAAAELFTEAKDMGALEEHIRLVSDAFLPGDGVAARDVASGVYFRMYTPMPGDTVIDAGAHVGHFSRVVMDLIGYGRVIACEPDARNYSKLTKSCQASAYNVALGDRAGFVKMRYDQSIGSASIRVHGQDVHNQLSGRFFSEETAICRTIDSFELERCNMIKVDVEGCEKFVIDGAMSTINRCKPHVVVEVDYSIDKNHPAQICATMGSTGYLMFGAQSVDEPPARGLLPAHTGGTMWFVPPGVGA